MTQATKERNDQIVVRHAAGETCLDIAPTVGLTRQRVEQIVRKLGGAKRQGGIYQQRHVRMQTLLAQLKPLLLEGLNKSQLKKRGISAQDLAWLLTKHPELRKQWKAVTGVVRYGISMSDLKEIAAKYDKTWQAMMALYQSSRKNAQTRGCVWSLNLAEWLKLWEASGAWSVNNFNVKPRYGLVAIDRADPEYRVGNVQIITQSEISTTTQHRVWNAGRQLGAEA